MAIFGRRPDGVLLTKLPGFRKMFPYLMPTRTESYIHYEHKIRVARTNRFLDQLNSGRTGPKITMFHVVLAAACRMMALRPDANRFVSGKRIYQRKEISYSFVTKKELTDTAAETNVKLTFQPTDTLLEVAQRVFDAVSQVKKSKSSADEDICDTLTALPRFMTRIALWGWKVLDYWNLLPASAIKGDSLYCSAYFANQGSIGLPAVQHHLFEWGNCPFFVVIGKGEKSLLVDGDGSTSVEDIVTSTFTLDERITDGVSYARIIHMLVGFIEDPQQLMSPPDKLPDPFELA